MHISFFRLVISDSHRQRFFGTHHDHQFFASANRCINQISLQKDIMLGEDWDDHSRIFGALRFMDGNGISQDNFIQVRKIIRHIFAIKIYDNLLGLGIYRDHPAQIGPGLLPKMGCHRQSLFAFISGVSFAAVKSGEQGAPPYIANFVRLLDRFQELRKVQLR